MAEIIDQHHGTWLVVAYNPKEMDAMLDNRWNTGILKFESLKSETRALFANKKIAMNFLDIIMKEAYQGDHSFVR